MATDHTPGPWAANLDASRTGRRWQITAPTPNPRRRYTVAVAISHDPADDATADADAALLAAAPDLLAACLAMRDKFASLLTLHEGRGTDATDFAAIEEADAAIAKATGNQPPPPTE